MKLALAALLTLLYILNGLVLDDGLSVYGWFIAVALAPSYYFLIKRITLQNNLGLIFFISYIHFSLIYAPLINLLLNSPRVLDQYFSLAHSLGGVLSILSSIALRFAPTSAKFDHSSFTSRPKLSVTLMLGAYLIGIWAIALLSYFLGVSPMGVPAPDLPFKLEPALNILRTVVFPTSFVIVWVALKNQGSRLKFLYLSALIAWIVFEVYATGSRGLILKSFIPFVIFIFLTKKITLKSSFLIFASLFITLLGGFIIGDYFRQGYVGAETRPSLYKQINTVYYRVFPDAYLIQKFAPYQSSFNKPLYDEYRGGANIHTYLIDQFEVSAAHNSGITGLTDGYLFAGTLGFILIGLTFIWVFILIDLTTKALMVPKVIAYVYTIQLLMFADGSISFIFYRSPVTTLSYPLVLAVLIWLTGTYRIAHATTDHR